jgi:VanZ family protein
LITSNLAHLFEFFILAILLGVAFSESGCHNALLFALASSLLIGNIDEGLQIFIRDRTSSVIDVFVDFAGACLGIVFLQFIKKHYRFRLIKIKD